MLIYFSFSNRSQLGSEFLRKLRVFSYETKLTGVLLCLVFSKSSIPRQVPRT